MTNFQNWHGTKHRSFEHDFPASRWHVLRFREWWFRTFFHLNWYNPQIFEPSRLWLPISWEPNSRPYEGKPMVNSPLIRPAVSWVGVTLGSHDICLKKSKNRSFLSQIWIEATCCWFAASGLLETSPVWTTNPVSEGCPSRQMYVGVIFFSKFIGLEQAELPSTFSMVHMQVWPIQHCPTYMRQKLMARN